MGSALLMPLTLYDSSIQQTVSHLSSTEWLLILYIALMGTGLGYFLYAKSIEQIGPDMAAYIIYSMTPVWVVLLTFLFFDDPISTWEIIGSLCIIGSLALHIKAN